jgi:hypothetical protein
LKKISTQFVKEVLYKLLTIGRGLSINKKVMLKNNAKAFLKLV